VCVRASSSCSSSSSFSPPQGFLINQPIPTVLGWGMHHLPLPVHIASYLFLFLVEIPGPFLYFFCGWPRLLGAALVVMLQVGINLTGTFGYFNALTSVLSLVLLDVNSSLLSDFQWGAETGSAGSLAHNALLAFLLLLHCVHIPFNSWCSVAFLHWPALNVPAGPIGNALRLIAPWHVSHAFGVFFRNFTHTASHALRLPAHLPVCLDSHHGPSRPHCWAFDSLTHALPSVSAAPMDVCPFRA